MHPVLIEIGGFTLYTYGFFVALGFISAVWISQYLARPYKIKPQSVTDIFFVILISAILGARMLYVLINFKEYQSNPLEIIKIWNGGLVFFGGFVAAAITLYIYLKKQKYNTWLIADIIAPGIAFGHALGRIGCLFAGCCYGKISDLPFAIEFSHPRSLAPLHVSLHPTQIYSAVSNLLIFVLLLWLSRKKKFNGMVFLCYVMIYSFLRAVIEFFRGDFRGDFLFDFLSLSQGIGIVVSIIALSFIYRLNKATDEPKQ